MTVEFLMCQAPPRCTDDATQTITVQGTNHSKTVCGQDVCVEWAKTELCQDHPGAQLVVTPFNPYRVEAS
ncbi:hypothetical protein Ade02nite_20380 [Paractinoplanes deccanensis]|uniref:DUF1540 domain-containing protein n=1 Tax=Paractinoplanes deccanensis TaxID=113561 RepID=A0ABQ3Y069_9ACTN|nr:hypothetical protein [Actinoplanes deccanensis]GID73397.1 hypothetical protein Ade02nite_20380 [Actinoplanes deccanensis]